MTNAYPELPKLTYQHTTVPMPDVVAHLQAQNVPTEVKRATYIIFRIESANGHKGINNNYVGAQADSGRWPAGLDPALSGTVTIPENQTGKLRIFLAFASWTGSVAFLADRVTARGLHVGGTTHQVLTMPVTDAHALARAYQKEWVQGSASAEPTAQDLSDFLSMYAQAEKLFTEGAGVTA
jgi:hypothetical protein